MPKVRSALPTEWSDLISLAEKAKEGLSQPAGFNWDSVTLQEELSQVFTLVADEPEGPAGFVCYRELPEAFEVSVLATAPRWQRQGVQTELIQYLQSLAATQDKEVWLEVHERNDGAVALYRKMGFEQLRIRRGYYSDGGGAFVMGWKAESE